MGDIKIVGRRSKYILLGSSLVALANVFGWLPPETAAKASQILGPLIDNPTFGALGYTLVKHFETK